MVEVGPNGVAENRRLHLVDAAGRMVNGKTSMRLTLVGSRLDSEAGTLALDFPGQGVVSGALQLGDAVRDRLLRPARERASGRGALERGHSRRGQASTCGW